MLSQIRALGDKFQAWVDKIIVGHLNRINITVTLNTKMGKLLSHLSTTITLSEDDCNNIVQQIVMAAHSTLGINKIPLKTVIFSLYKLQNYGPRYH